MPSDRRNKEQQDERMTRGFRPEARRRRLVTQHLEGETLVYDRDTHQAHCLTPFASRLWEACDGQRTMAELRTAGKWSDAEVVRGIDHLARAGLLKELPPMKPTRRRALARLGRAAAVPVLVSILVPDAAAAATCIPLNGPCTTSANCCPGRGLCCKDSSGTCRTVGGGACH